MCLVARHGRLSSKRTGRKLTGTARQATGVAVEISAGKINESTITFKTTRCSDPCETIITFRGTLKGDEITFTRYVEVKQGGLRLGNGLFGAAPKFRTEVYRKARDRGRSRRCCGTRNSRASHSGTKACNIRGYGSSRHSRYRS